MKSLKAALISALAGQGMEIFLFFLGGVLLQKAEDPYIAVPSFAGNVFEKIQSKRKIQSEAGKKAL